MLGDMQWVRNTEERVSIYSWVLLQVHWVDHLKGEEIGRVFRESY